MDFEQNLQEHAEDISPEEKEKIYEEMNEMMMKAKNTVAGFDFSVRNKEAKSGLRFPLTTIIVLVLLLSGSISGVWLYSMKTEQSSLILDKKKINSETFLAQILIEENKKKTALAEGKIQDIADELSKVNSERQTLESEFEERVVLRKKELEVQIEEELTELRNQLINQGISQQQIEERILAERRKIELENSQILENFRLQINQEKTVITAEYEQRVENLRQQQQQQESALANLQLEIEQKEAEIEQRAQEIDQELASAQKNLSQLRENKEEREKAISTFDIYFKNIKQNISSGEYQKAIASIQQGQNEIKSSIYSSDPFVTIYINSFNIQESIIKNLITLQKNAIRTSEGDSESFRQSIAEVTKELEEAQQRLNDNQALLEEEKRARVQDRKQIQEVTTLQQRTEQDLKTTLKRLDNASITFSKIELGLRESQEKTLSNIEIIIKYIQNKETETVDEEINQQLKDLLEQLPVYNQIGAILTKQITKKNSSFP